MFMVYLYTVLYIQLKRRVKHFLDKTVQFFIFCKNVVSTNVAGFYSVYYHTSFPDLKESANTSVSTTSFVGNRKSIIEMTSSGAFFIISFVKICHMFQKFIYVHRIMISKNLRSLLRKKNRLMSARRLLFIPV
jgi:hypothetical protein